MALEELLENAGSVTLREHHVNLIKRGFDVLVDGEVIGEIVQKTHLTGTDEFRLTLEDGTYLGRIVDTVSVVDKFKRPGIKATVYDADENILIRLDQNIYREKIRNPLTPRVWGTLRDAHNNVVATIDKHREDSPLHFDLYTEDNNNILGSIDQRDKRGRHTYAVNGIDNVAMLLVTAMLDQLYHHTSGTKW